MHYNLVYLFEISINYEIYMFIGLNVLSVKQNSRIKKLFTCRINIRIILLVRTPLNVYFTAFKSSFLSLYAHINSDECHAWFHLNAASPAVRNAEQVNITKNSYPR